MVIALLRAFSVGGFLCFISILTDDCRFVRPRLGARLQFPLCILFGRFGSDFLSIGNRGVFMLGGLGHGMNGSMTEHEEGDQETLHDYLFKVHD